MKSIYVLIIIFLGAGITTEAQMELSIKSEKLSFEWSTEQVFEVPEAVCYDPERDILFVANINGTPTEKDGNGYISTMTTGGELISRMWITDLHAPKGMGVHKGNLYVTDIDMLIQIDIKSGNIVNVYPAEGATFLNDIAIDRKGKVYVSDMMDTKIYRLSNETFEVWLDDPILTNPNGLWAGDTDLFVGCKKLLKVNLKDTSFEVVSEDTGSIDGLEGTANGGFLYSDWSGNIYYLSPENEIEHLLSSEDKSINAADIEYLPSGNLIFVPTFFDNRVMAYSFTE